MTIADTLQQRNATHGDFAINARCSQALKLCIKEHTKTELTDVQIEALEVICAKIARILIGDPNHADSWHDIAGYALLVERTLLNE